jgi:DNA-binding MarR family transcriptional regulator
MRAIYATIRHRSRQVRRATGIGSAMTWALSEITARPGARIGELAQRLRIHPSTASNLCSRLRRAGLIVARPSADDRRAMCLFPTRRSGGLLRQTSRPQRGLLMEAIAQMSPGECDALVAALEPLRRALENSAEPAD